MPEFTNPYRLPRGTVVVVRVVYGVPMALAINPEWHYPEWGGCFSLL